MYWSQKWMQNISIVSYFGGKENELNWVAIQYLNKQNLRKYWRIKIGDFEDRPFQCSNEDKLSRDWLDENTQWL